MPTRRLKPLANVIEQRRSGDQLRTPLPAMITIDEGGGATAIYPQRSRDRAGAPLTRRTFTSLSDLLEHHVLEDHEVEELRPLALYPLTALVIEDDLALREVIAELLSEEGYRFTVAATLHDARERIAKERPNVVLLDLVLGGESGEVLLSDLTHDELAPAIVIVSAHRDARKVAERYRVGLLSKPFDVDDLVRAIEEAIREQRRPTRA